VGLLSKRFGLLCQEKGGERGQNASTCPATKHGGVDWNHQGLELGQKRLSQKLVFG